MLQARLREGLRGCGLGGDGDGGFGEDGRLTGAVAFKCWRNGGYARILLYRPRVL